MQQHLYLLGHPITKAAFPVIMQAACDSLGLNLRCEIWELADPSRLPEAMQAARGDTVLGIQVTMPYKASVIPLLDRLGEEAQAIGAVNTVYKEGRQLIGANTDAAGFITSLTRDGEFDPKGKRVTILGAGGAARACGFALIQAGARSITVLNRTMPRLEGAVSALRAMSVEVEVQGMGYDDHRLREVIATSGLVVNSTPFGMKYGPLEGKVPIPENAFQRGQMVYDVVYKPTETPFLRMARTAGARTLNGMGWSIYSCAAAFRLFTRTEPPLEAMSKAAHELARTQGW